MRLGIELRWRSLLLAGLFLLIMLPALVGCGTTSDPTPTPPATTYYTLTTGVSPTGAGCSISLSPTGGLYTSGTIITVTPVAASNYIFDHWEGDLTGNANPALVVMNSSKTITAVFTLRKFNTNFTYIGSGHVNETLKGAWNAGSTVTLTAVPDLGWRFDHWNGAVSGTENPKDILMDMDKNITAVFVAAPILTPTPSPTPTPIPTPVGSWHHYLVDSANNVGQWSSIAVNSYGYPRISYYDATAQKLKYAEMSGSGWSSLTVDPSLANDCGSYSSIALDSYNNPHISCYRGYNGMLYYYNRIGSTWYRTIVDSGIWGGYAYLVGSYSSIAIDDYNHPHISYYNSTSKALDYAVYDGSNWHIYEFAPDGRAIGQYSSIALDSYNNPHIVCYDATDGALLYGTGNYSTGTFNWTIITNGTDIVGQSCSIAIDSSNNVHISYLDTTTGYLNYVKKSGVNWSYHIFNTLGVQMGNYQSSIAVDNNNYPHISCYDSTTGNLLYLKWDGLIWNSTTIYSTLHYIGKYSDIAVYGNNPFISYYDSTNGDLCSSSFGDKSIVPGNTDLKTGKLDFTVIPGQGRATGISVSTKSKVTKGMNQEDPDLKKGIK